MASSGANTGVYCDDEKCPNGPYPLPPFSKRTTCRTCNKKVCRECYERAHRAHNDIP